jgi:hypothetical protein
MLYKGPRNLLYYYIRGSYKNNITYEIALLRGWWLFWKNRCFLLTLHSRIFNKFTSKSTWDPKSIETSPLCTSMWCSLLADSNTISYSPLACQSLPSRLANTLERAAWCGAWYASREYIFDISCRQVREFQYGDLKYKPYFKFFPVMHVSNIDI